MEPNIMKNYTKKELGDYQTPLFFTESICRYLKDNLNISPDIIIEPTCGTGNFLKSASEVFPDAQLYGIDIDRNKLKQVEKLPNLKLINENIFTFNFDRFDKNKSFLILGNPPWITNTDLSKINSTNVPEKSNYRKLREIDAMTGDSNFDISQYIILEIIREFKNTTSTIALLCKTTVARNIFLEMNENNTSYSLIKQLNFNAYKIFKIDAESCLLIIQFGETPDKSRICEVSNLSKPEETLYRFGFVNDRFYSNIENIEDIDGECQLEWRQGVKHDCAGIMELTCKNSRFVNKNKDTAAIEDTLVYPLLKSSDLKSPIIHQSSRYIIITQQKIKQNTSYIRTLAPETWKYLSDNREYFTRRKSSIYENAPDFSIFGIGEYSFKKYKVAISGFYKKAMFCLVYSDKSIMLDDTCYYLSFDDYDSAYITMLILNSELVQNFLKNVAFLDSKRPYSKKVLRRIDLKKCLKILTFEDLKECEEKLELETYITKEKFITYKNLHVNMDEITKQG